MNASLGLDLNLLRQLSVEVLTRLLQELPGKKDFIIDPTLMKPLDRGICGAAVLKNQGVEKIYQLEKKPPPQSTNGQRIYLFSSNLVTAKIVADHISSEVRQNLHYKYQLIIAPRILVSITKLFEEEGIYGNVTFCEYAWELIPVGHNVLSLEIPSVFSSFYLDGDQCLLASVARSVWRLQMLFGDIPQVYGQGRAAELVYKMSEMIAGAYDKPKVTNSEIGYLFIFDRNIDYVSPLLTPLTYESLLDEKFGIKVGVVEFGKEVTGKDGTVKMQLNDDVYKEIRGQHFSHVFTLLGTKTKQLLSLKSKRHNMSIAEMRQFVDKDLMKIESEHRSVAMHLSASEVIMKAKHDSFEEHLSAEHSIVLGEGTRECVSYLEDCMARQESMYKVLRLLCLYSHTQNGLSEREYQTLKTQFVQSYGFEHLVTLTNCEKLGLFGTSLQAADNFATRMAQVVTLSRHSAFRNIAKRLALIPEESCDLKHPTDPSYVFNGAYVPVACAIVREILLKGFTPNLKEGMKLLPGLTIEAGKRSDASDGNFPSRVVLVYIVGGITYAEVAAFQLLGSVIGYKFILAGTSILNGDTLLQSVSQKSLS